MSDETVMQAADRQLADTGLHAVTPGSVERLVAEVERLRADALESIAREGVLRAEVERLQGHVDDLMLGDNATIDRLRAERAELFRLRAVVEAARAIVTRDEWRAARMGVAELESYEAVEALGLLDALEQALAALDAGEGELDDARFRAEAEAASKADRAEVERLRSDAAGNAEVMIGCADRLRAASDRASRAEAEVERLGEVVATQAARENTLRDERWHSRQEVERLRAERDALREAAQWILHTISGVSRDGGPVTDDECLASYDALRAAIEGEGGSDERE